MLAGENKEKIPKATKKSLHIAYKANTSEFNSSLSRNAKSKTVWTGLFQIVKQTNKQTYAVVLSVSQTLFHCRHSLSLVFIIFLYLYLQLSKSSWRDGV